ncbi:MAG: tRNA uridine(34) 5-carboxymethylaminomethyl modification radical SAM/GNAT enzyme Elp3 [Candidatus Jordarchaeum sp.]|uniref:tRNA uridine(34) 5-carboxymethylaminomethyl modification radical SAM/GNAT enzyme Elp3 n=1 Tax=Candidatus Jordarchaeum sp. TaxID=2823881 RepID=UPI004049F743
METVYLPEIQQKEAYRKIIEHILNKKEKVELNKLKTKVCQEYHLNKVPSNSEILNCASEQERSQLLPMLRKKKTRTISGIAIVAVMSKPAPCPGNCVYCPGGTIAPKSYSGYEPAAMRGIQNNYDPYMQVKSRLNQLEAIGHRVKKGKIKLVIMGGTFLSLPIEYQHHFIRRCLDAITGIPSETLDEAKNNAENSRTRNVGITFETRPDYCRENHIDNMLYMGGTKVEIGVQTVYDDIYKFINRGHTVEDVIASFRMAKDSGLKITAHVMPNLPGSNYNKDLKTFETLFNDPRFKPDSLKIYPCLVLEDTHLYDLYLKGDYTPYSTDEIIKLVAEVKRMIPKWIRIQRIQRDIPSKLIIAGVKNGNLRELAAEELQKTGDKCQCIRCREVGHVLKTDHDVLEMEDIFLHRESYSASEGEEIFISFENRDRSILVGFLRLRLPSELAHRNEIQSSESMMVRELHVYGPLVPIYEKPKDEWQHRGYGKKLLSLAEKIAREEYDAKKLLVLSGLGVKEYYYKLGYKPDGVYVSKKLN